MPENVDDDDDKTMAEGPEDPGDADPPRDPLEETAAADEPEVSEQLVEPDDRSPPQAPAAQPRRPWLLVLVAVLALVALGASSYVFWRTEIVNPIGQETAALGEALQRVDQRSADDTGKLRAELHAALENVERDRLAQSALIAEQQTVLAETIAAQRNSGPPSERAWKLAEVEYLLRIANHRLLMERDVIGTLDLLASADNVLEELDDFSMHEVRARLADERLSLQRVKSVDVQGVYLRIEALKSGLGTLPLRLPQYLPGYPAAVAQGEPAAQADRAAGSDADALEVEESTWARMSSRLSSLFEFRRHEGIGTQPLLRPEQADYLEQSLRLALERAQLAALRQEQVLFETNLEEAAESLRAYLDLSREPVQEALIELDGLLAIDLEVALPDVSGSLLRLVELKRLGLDDVQGGSSDPAVGQRPIEADSVANQVSNAPGVQ